jgi:hypothetical protein
MLVCGLPFYPPIVRGGGLGGSGPGFGGFLYGVAVTVRYVAGVMIWSRCTWGPPRSESTLAALA